MHDVRPRTRRARNASAAPAATGMVAGERTDASRCVKSSTVAMCAARPPTRQVRGNKAVAGAVSHASMEHPSGSSPAPARFRVSGHAIERRGIDTSTGPDPNRQLRVMPTSSCSRLWQWYVKSPRSAGATLRRTRSMRLICQSAHCTMLLWSILSHGTGSEVMQRIAAPMVGGMVTATLLSLLVIPAAWFLLMRRRLSGRQSTNR